MSLIRLAILPLLLSGCLEESPVYSDMNYNDSAKMPPTNPGNKQDDSGEEYCYNFNDNSLDLELLNPGAVDVLHYDNENTTGPGRPLNILFVFTNHSGVPIVDNPASSVEFDMLAFGDAFFENADGARYFFEESSFGDLSFTGTVLGWMDFADSGTSNLSVNGGGFWLWCEGRLCLLR